MRIPFFMVSLLLLLSACKGGGGSNEENQKTNFNLNGKSDPLYQYSWHLKNNGQKNFTETPGVDGYDLNVYPVWEMGISGKGVEVGVSDGRIDLHHEDLIANSLLSKSRNYLSSAPFLGDPNNSEDNHHGTSVSGIIGAEAFNEKGSRGVAFNSKIAGMNLIGSDQSTAKRIDQTINVLDIFNYSYGSPECFIVPDNEDVNAAMTEGAVSLRKGKGAIYIKSAGNSYRGDLNACSSSLRGIPFLGNSIMDQDRANPYIITVGAINAQGIKSSYSSPGANLWITGTGGEFGDELSSPAIITADLEGCSMGSSKSSSVANDFENNRNGLNPNCNYTSTMNGTSSAAPSVSGVVALMLEANPNLTWRDVKHILASTARVIDSNSINLGHPWGFDLPGHIYDYGWTTNAKGYMFHNYYGFGLVDAKAAVDLAKNYTLNFGEFKTAGETSGIVNLAIPDNNATGATSSIGFNYYNLDIESVQINLYLTHPLLSDLGVELISPSGTKSKLMWINSNNIDGGNIAIKLISNAFYGENAKGYWTLKIVDGLPKYSGTLIEWNLFIHGHKPLIPDDTTPPNPIGTISNAKIFNSKTSTPEISFIPTNSNDLLRYEASVGTSIGLNDVKDWQSIHAQTTFTLTGLSLTEGAKYYINIRAIDTSENISEARSSLWFVDSVAPTKPSILTLINPNTNSGSILTPTIRVSAVTTGDVINLYTDSSCSIKVGSTTASANFVDITTISLSRGYYYFYANATDPAGNTSACSSASAYYYLNIPQPSAPSGISLVSPTSSPSNNKTPSIRISGVSNGNTVSVYSNSTCTTLLKSGTSTGTTIDITLNSLVDGAYSLYAKTYDNTAGYSGCSLVSLFYVVDTSPPQAPSSITLKSPTTTPSNIQTPTIQISGVNIGDKIELFSNFSCSLLVGSTTATSNPSTITTTSLAEGQYAIYSKATDPAGNSSSCSTANVSYKVDITAPNAPSSLSLVSPASTPSNNTTPTIRISGVSAGDIISLYSTSNCSNKISSTVATGSFVDMKLSTLSQGTFTFYATSSDTAGNTSACSTAYITYVLDTTPPTAPNTLTLISPSTSPGNNPTPTIRVAGVSANDTVYLYSDSTCTSLIGSGVSTGTSIDITTSAFSTQTTYNIYSKARDLAGNLSTCSTAKVSYTLDTAAPAAPSSLALSTPNSTPHYNKTPTIQVNGLTSGDKVELFTDSNCLTKVGSATATSTNALITSSTLSFGDYTFYAKSTDPAGNASSCSIAKVAYTVDRKFMTFPQNLSTYNRIPSESINAVYVDDQGTIFVGTSGGLSISTDGGNTFVTKTTYNGLGNNYINDILIDKNGTMFVATNYGLSISYDNGNSFTNKLFYTSTGAEISYQKIAKLVYDPNRGSNGTVYIGTYIDGLYYTNDSGIIIQTLGVYTGTSLTDITVLTNGYLMMLTAWGTSTPCTFGCGSSWWQACGGTFSTHLATFNDSNGYNYISEADGSIYKTNVAPPSATLTRMTKNFTGTVSRGYLGRSQNLYLASSSGLQISNGNQFTFTQKTTNDGLLSNSINSIFEDILGKVYIGTSKGLSILSSSYSTSKNVSNSGFIQGTIRYVAKDDSGKIFVGTNLGISLSTDNGYTFTNKNLTDANDQAGNTVNKIYISKNGTIFIGTINGIYSSLDSGLTFSKFILPNTPSHTNVTSIAEGVSGDVYISINLGSNNFTFYKTVDNGSTYSKYEPISFLRNIIADNNGSLYFITENGLYKLINGEFKGFSGLADIDFSFGVSFSAQGNYLAIVNNIYKSLYTSTDGGATFQKIGYLQGDAREIKILSNGNVYAPNSKGLFISRNSGTTTYNATTEWGLSDNSIYNVFVDSTGTSFISTSYGISILEP